MDINWNISPQDITKITELFIKKSLNVARKIIDMDITEDKIPVVLCLLADDMTDYMGLHSMCSFIQFVSPNDDLRSACRKADNRLSSYIYELNTNKDIYNKIKEMYSKFKNSKIMGCDEIQFIKHIILSYKKYGAHLNDEDTNKLYKIREEISKIESHIISELTADDVRDFSIKVGKRNVNIKLNEPTYNQHMKHNKNESIRKTLDHRYNNKYRQHMINFARLVVLRDKHSKILSFNNHSELSLTNSMAQNPKNISQFLEDISDLVETKYNNELKVLERLKRVDKNSSIIYNTDINYYLTRWKIEYGLNEEDVSNYFPEYHVIGEILNVYQDLFDLEFKREKMETTWHSDVVLYGVYQGKKMIGQFYLDLYERPKKYPQTKCFALQSGCIYPLEHNKYYVPISAMISSIKKDSCLSHSCVVSLFHEFGHIIHQICGKTAYCIFSGTNVESDFVELPSMILENLCWNRIILKRLSKHVITGQELTDDIIHKMISIKYLNAGLASKNSIIIGLYDSYIHSSDEFISACHDAIKRKNNDECVRLFITLYKNLFEHVMKGIRLNEDTIMPIIWTNFLGNSECKNYGHIWGKVYSSDVYYSCFEDKHTFESIKKECLKLRKSIFDNGGTVSGFVMLRNILGRKANNEGFSKLNHLEELDEASFYLETDMIEGIANNDTEESNNFSEIVDTCTYEI